MELTIITNFQLVSGMPILSVFKNDVLHYNERMYQEVRF